MKLPVLLALASAASAADMFPFQLPWDDSTPSITNIAWLNDKPAGRDGFVHVKDGHLFAGEKRLRIFGVNMCFAANFPKHDDADKIAARLAKFGINCVRFHHMDMFSAPAGIFEKDGRTLDAGQLDKLDYFIAALKKHGIYANLNLHVSRTYPDLPKADKKGSPQFDKGVDNYHAPMIALQKTYARDLLTHVNKYTGNAYAVEPAVALVEINNENALGFQWFAREMDDLPPIYKEDLETQWGAWILKKYGDDAAARKAWSEGERAPGRELIGEMKQASRIRSDIFGPMRQIASFAESGLVVRREAERHAAFGRGFLENLAPFLFDGRLTKAVSTLRSATALQGLPSSAPYSGTATPTAESGLVVRREAERHAAFGRGFLENLAPFLFDGRLTKAVSTLRSATALQGLPSSASNQTNFCAFSGNFTPFSATFLSFATTVEAFAGNFLSFAKNVSGFAKSSSAFAKTGSAFAQNDTDFAKTALASVATVSSFSANFKASASCKWLTVLCFETTQLGQSAEHGLECVEGGQQSAEVLRKVGKISFNFETHGAAMAKGSMQNGKVSVIVDEPSSELWHVQFTLGEISLEAGSYEVKFRARGPVEGEISVGLQQSSSPWKVLGSGKVKVGTDWRDVSVIVSVGSAEERGRLTIGGMGLTEGHYEFSDFSLRSVGIEGGLVRDAKGRVPMVKKRELSRVTPAKQRDWQEFLWDTELVYWNGMRDFLKKELGVRAPIVGTQGFWSPGHVQSGMDVIDSHAYWEHPDFEGGAWNPERWTVKNIPMSGVKGGGTLPALAAQRVKGKPFICTEYNHSAPNTYGAETAPIIAAFAALQDWDGVFIFAYSHNDKWQQEHFDSFFDIARHPVKMATLPGAVLSFRRGDLSSADGVSVTTGLSRSSALDNTLLNGPVYPLEKFTGGLGTRFPRARWAYLPSLNEDYMETSASGGSHIFYPYVQWETPNSVAIHGDLSFAIITREKAVGLNHGTARLSNIETLQGWICYQLTVIDGEALPTSKRLLITATGSIENTKMGWKNAERTTVGRDWGMPPVLVEGPKATIDLPGGGRFKAWALDERGQRREEVPVRDAKLEIGPQFKTLWYEVERL